MKITALETLHADGGTRPFSFVKVTTKSGLVGWSEYTEAVGNMGVTAAIERLGGLLIGEDSTRVEWAMAKASAKTIPVPSGIGAHARGAVANALLDVAAKAAGVSVSAMFGGKVRDRIPLYWTHFCGPRIHNPEVVELPEVRSYADISELAVRAKEEGYAAVKMNFFSHDGNRFTGWSPGHGVGNGYPALNPDKDMFNALERQIEAIRKETDIAVMVDLNFNFKLEGFTQICRTLEKWDLYWAELDMYDPTAMARLKERTTTPIVGGESLYGRRGYRPYFENYAMDVAVVDVIWNGFLESYKIAMMAETYELNVAPHNFYGYLADHISGHFAATIPNLKIMEYEVEDMPWRGDFYTHAPVIENGEMLIPDRPGWGTDVIEEAVRARPWQG